MARGRIYKRGDTYTIIYDEGRDARGKRRQRSKGGFRTKKAAEAALAKALNEVDSGRHVAPSKLTLSEYMERWVRDYVDSGQVRETTARRYRSIIRLHIIPHLGHLRMNAMRPDHIEDWHRYEVEECRQDGRKKSGLSSTTALQHHHILSEAIKHAMRRGLIERNVCQLVDAPRRAWAQMHPLDDRQLSDFLAAAQETHPDLWIAFEVAAYTGLRRSELVGLRWRDVDLDMMTLSVVQTLHHLDGQAFYEPPKTRTSRRSIKLFPRTCIALREHREHSPGNLIFTTRGQHMNPNHLTKTFTRIARSFGAPDSVLHDLRHTHATMLLRQGVHPKIVQERLGHSSVAVTLDIYSHVTPTLQASALRAIEDLF